MAEKFGMDFSKAASAEQRRTRMLVSNDPEEIKDLREGKPMRQRQTKADDEGSLEAFRSRLRRAGLRSRGQRNGKAKNVVKAAPRRRRRVQLAEPLAVRRGLAVDVEDPSSVNKASYEPLKTNMSEHDAKRVTSRVGLAGELPKHYSREQRMGAYEARYVASGGRKGEKYQRRANAGDKAKTAGLAVATAGGAAILASRTKAAGRMKHVGAIRRAADTSALAGATVGGGAELYAGSARRKRASYASAPGGAAASALRRMRAMDQARGQS